ncbi:Nucleolar protein 9 [Coemansia sp. RSA 1821]|nr:Nucleolar protein 9 [Coemansia sp. RSA 1821]
MAFGGKRKVRRGKRGGENKHEKSPDAETATFNAQAVGDEYTAPPMEGESTPFTSIEAEDGDHSMDIDENNISPASYGLVNPELQSYLKSCEAMLDNPQFELPEDRIIFVNNVYSEIKNYELQLTTDHECSRILEKLFRISSEYQIKRFFALTRDDTIRLVIHRFSSHTIQTLLLLTAVALEREMRGESSDLATGEEPDSDAVRTEMPKFEELVLTLVDTLQPMWSFLMSNEYASHILRVLLLVLSGRPIEDQTNPKNTIKSRRSAKYVEDRNGEPINHPALAKQRTVPESFATALDKLLEKASESISEIVARDLANSPVGSPVLQLMLSLQAEKSQLEKDGSLLDKCLMGLVSDGPAHPRRDAVIGMMLQDVVGSHFLQRAVELMSPKLLKRFYKQYICSKLKELAFHPISNFVVQSVLSNAKTDEQLKSMIAEIQPHVGDLLFKQRPGVVRALLDSSIRLKCGAAEITDALYQGLGASGEKERKELINLLAFLVPYSRFVQADYNRLPFSLQGSLIIQSILKLPSSSCEPLMESFFAQDPDMIYEWCKDPSGSRIIEAIISSKQLPVVTKRRVLERYANKYADLAANKYGSHIVDACWRAADIPYKEKILIELLQRETQVRDSPFGRIVMSNCRADQYKRRVDEWRERERNIQKRKRLFEDILDGDTSTAAATATQNSASSKRYKKAEEKDEIDELFATPAAPAKEATKSQATTESQSDANGKEAGTKRSKKDKRSKKKKDVSV